MWGYAFRGTPEELATYEADTSELIMNTGGSIEMMESALADGSVPADAAISEFYVVKDGHYVPYPEYQAYIEDVVGYRREAVYAVCAELIAGAQDDPEMAELGLTFQPRDSLDNVENWRLYEENPTDDNRPIEIEVPQKNKISFYCTGGPDASTRAVQEIQEALDRNGMGHFHVVLTADSYEQGRYLIDVIPLGKKEAADIVIELLTKQFGPVLAAVAGDAQNDAEVILNSGAAAIAVGNRVDDLDRIIQDQPTTRETGHFKIVDGPTGNRLIYKGSKDLAVGASLKRGIQALERAEVLIKDR